MEAPSEQSGPAVPVRLTRPARALIGWLEPNEAALWLAGRHVGQHQSPENLQRAAEARAAVQRRTSGLTQDGIIAEAPSEIVDHVAALGASPVGAAILAEGFRVVVADLREVCAVQPHIYTEDAAERLAGIASGDMRALASVTIPIPTDTPFPAQFDEAKKSWIFTSANPNLRILEPLAVEIRPGKRGFGFGVEISPSFVQIARYQGRYLLRDGYHRAYGCLARGLTHVPVILRDFSSSNELNLPSGLLPQDAYLGDRPPVLKDYLDDEVSASIQMGAIQKLIVIQGLELGTTG